jgi:Tol biopolymer transport system component
VLAAALALAGLVLVPACSKAPTPPTVTDDDLAPRWATDRALIAFLHVASTSSSRPPGLYVLDTLSHTSRLVLAGMATGFDWIPGTDTLVVAVGGNISLVARSGVVLPLTSVPEAFNCDAAPDGNRIAYDAAAGTRSAVFIYDRAANTTTNVTPDTMLYYAPAWSPDGSQLAVIGGSSRAFGLILVQPTGDPRRQLRQSSQDLGSPAWSPDGLRLCWYEQSSAGIRELFTTDTVSAVPKVLTPCRTGGSWSPDGQLIAFSAQTASGARLFVLQLATGSVRQLNY